MAEKDLELGLLIALAFRLSSPLSQYANTEFMREKISKQLQLFNSWLGLM